MTTLGSDGRASFARMLFCASLTALGLVHLIFGEAVTRLFPVWPSGLPGRPYWAHVAGLVLLILGALTLLKKNPRNAAAAIGLLIFLSVLCLHLPRSIRSGNFGDEWLNVFKWSTMAAGAFVVADRFSSKETLAPVEGLIRFFATHAKWFLAAFMIGAAILHLRYTAFVAPFIPAFIPWRVFWVQFTAVALAAGGLGLLVPATARLAALLTSLMIFLWFLLVHLPHTVADPFHNAGWSEMFEALAFSALAYLLAQTKRASAATS